jgi:hypothetical protein
MRTLFQLYAKLAVILVMASPFTCYAGDQPSKTTALESDTAQFKLDIRFIDINRERLSEAGIDLRELTQDASLTMRRAESVTDQSLAVRLNEREGNLITKLLTASGAGKVIAEPTIVVSDGRAASVQTAVDGEVSIAAAEGIQGAVADSLIYVVTIDILANKQPSGSVRLELRAEHARLRDAKDASTSQALERRVLDTAFELNSGS